MLRYVLLVVGLLGAFITGCGKENGGPKVTTVPAMGIVRDVSGKPVTGGTISLRSVKNPEQVAFGTINEQGDFTLKSLVGEERVDGAQPGEYSVLFAPITDKQTEPPVTLKKTYVIKEGQGELEIKLE